MMDRSVRSLALLGASLAACAAGAPAAVAARDRSVRVTVAPAPGEVSLVQIAFPHPGSARLGPATLDVSAPGVFGADYLAVATLRPALGGQRALVLVANRPSALLDPALVVLSVRARRSLGVPRVERIANLFARVPSAPAPPLCDLALHGGALTAAGLVALGASGAPLGGLGGSEALAQAYDIACGLPDTGTLRRAVSSPVGGGCTPCDPAPGYACPLTEAAAALCAEPVGSRLRAAAGANH
jgi:hypothetical protein